MNLRAHAMKSIETSRQAVEMVLAEFKTADDWFCQPAPNTNHALWIVAHLGLADNYFASKFRPEVDQKPEGWDELFWFGSTISDDRSVYPSPEEVLAYFHDRRSQLISVLNEMSDEELLAEPEPNEGRVLSGAPSVGQLFFFASFHEGIHMGQLSCCHRALGLEPVMKPEEAAS